MLFAGFVNAANSAESSPPDEIIIRYRTADRHADHGKVARRLGNHAEVVKLEASWYDEPADAKSQRLRQKIRQIQLDPDVLYAEPNFRGRFEETLPAIPNDPSYVSQWWLPAVGDRELWALGRGAGVVVAVIDTGVDLAHPDLVHNLLPGGYNFGDGNDRPQDVLGHGTKVAGIIAARQNNSIGVSGLAPEAAILPIKINVAGQNSFSSDQLAKAIAYAVDQGAKIINLSLTVDEQTQTVQEAIQAALNRGVMVVAAAGNNGGPVEFPATMPGVFAVAATDQSRRLASQSNFGPEILVAAPGVNVLSTSLGGGFGASIPGGTSFAAPVVTAAIADLLSINPALPPSLLSKQLRDTATAIVDAKPGFGILHAGGAGNSVMPRLQLSKQQVSAGDSVSVDLSLPPTGGAVDIYVAAATPAGMLSLGSNGSWTPATGSGFQPLLTGYRNDKSLSGALFGNNGAFPAVELRGLPAGPYSWAVAMFATATGRLLGDVITTPMELH